jgi:hypothetical protein
MTPTQKANQVFTLMMTKMTMTLTLQKTKITKWTHCKIKRSNNAELGVKVHCQTTMTKL